MIYFDLDSRGFFIDEIHKAIPETALEITNEAYKFFLLNNGKCKVDEKKLGDLKKITIDMLDIDSRKNMEYEYEKTEPSLEEQVKEMQDVIDIILGA